MDGVETTSMLESAGSATNSRGPKRVSLSELTTYKGCRRKWYLSYYRKLKRRDKSGALALGTNVHSALGEYYSPGGTKESAMAVFGEIYAQLRFYATEYEIDGIEKDFELGYIMLEGYWQWVEETGADQLIDVIATESEIETTIDVAGVPVVLMGKRDLVYRNTMTGASGFLDFKTAQSLDNSGIDITEQPRMYGLLERLANDVEIQEILWVMLKKVKRTARANPPFYKMDEVYLSEEELRRFFLRTRGVIRDWLLTQAQLDDGQDPYEFAYPRPSRDCEWMCEFRRACPLMDQDPQAAEAMLQDMFTVGDPYERYESKGIG